ncbi:MAG: hypothetical protein GXO07_05535 [Crenarchaeota archaeon]|nr:hypothetical protein [Thermoproteota archaeon]
MAEKKDYLKELLEFIKNATGEDGVKVFKELMRYEDISEEQLVEVLGMKPNDVRRALYKLEKYGLVKNYKIRSEDENTYIYYWYIDREMLNRNLLKIKKDVLSKLKRKLETEEDEYFYCPTCGMQFTYEEAMANEFTCPRCGEGLELVEDNTKKRLLTKLVKRLEEEIKHEESVL